MSDYDLVVSDYVEIKIKRGLVRYLKEVEDIAATEAYLGETDTYYYREGYCDTCSFTVTDYSFYIHYTLDNGRTGNVEIKGDPLNFFPTLYEYMEK